MANPVRVAHVYATDLDQVSPGGIMTSLTQLLGHLSNRFQPFLVGVGTSRNGGDVHTRINGRDLLIVPVVPVNRRARWVPLNIAFTFNLFKVKARVLESADLIHASRMESAIPFVIRKTKPVVLTVHGASKYHVLCQTGMLRWALVRRIYDLVEGLVLSRIDRAIFVSTEGFEYYSQRYSRLRGKFLTIPNSIDVSAFSPIERTAARSVYGLSSDALVVVYAGRLSREKRVDLLLDAFAAVSRANQAAQLLIAGDGPEREPLRQHASRLGLSSVKFLGQLPRHDVPTLLSCADVFVLLSSFEGFPYAVLEALSCGVPVVATDVGGIRDILVGRLGRFILESVDAESVKERILEAASMREEVAHLCIARAGEFDSQKIFASLEDVYLSLTRTVPDGQHDTDARRH